MVIIADKVGGHFGVPETEFGVADGKHQVTIYNKKAGLYLPLPINPIDLKWDGELVMNVHDTKAGYHYQFIKYRRTQGRMRLTTGSGRGISFGEKVDSQFGGGRTRNAYHYLMRLGWVWEQWAKKAVTENVGPLRLVDQYAGQVEGLGASRPIVFDIIPRGFPGFGPEAGKQSYEVTLQFEILNDYIDNYDMAQIKVDVMPALGRAKDVVYTAKAGETAGSLAKKFYGDASLSILIKQVGANDKYIDKDGKLTPGATILIPYAPIPREYRGFGSGTGTGNTALETEPNEGDLSKVIADVFGAIQDAF